MNVIFDLMLNPTALYNLLLSKHTLSACIASLFIVMDILLAFLIVYAGFNLAEQAKAFVKSVNKSAKQSNNHKSKETNHITTTITLTR